MNEQMLFRLAMILQNQAPSTLNKALCKLSETILCDYEDGLSVAEIQDAINQQFSLAFSADEIKKALDYKARNEVYYKNEKYYIRDHVKQRTLAETPFSDSLKQSIEEYSSACPCSLETEEISDLLIRYLYYCFNSNVDNLLSLCDRKIVGSASASFDATNEQIAIINGFITWENPKKDALVYSIVSTCYDYCMLTIKKDAALSRELFKGKRFYFDANLIFRIAGINNVERQVVSQRFVNHCKDAGISLLCTTATIDEVYRVLSAQIDYIIGIAGENAPVDCEVLKRLSPDLEVNDFYRLYYEWCQKPQNTPGDYLSFSEHLREMVNDVFIQLEVKESGAYKTGSKEKEYSNHVHSLVEYKNNKRKWRKTSRSSAETDVTNILDTIELRRGTGNSIWQTNDFIVSADQLLIGWTNDSFNGVPLVVLPSVWLSIILRFNGRTEDDYKSFCLFLTQRYHIDPANLVDPRLLLESINIKTTKTEIKERILLEIAQNKASYNFDTADEYDTSVDRAFDVILNELSEKTDIAIDEIKKQMTAEVAAAKVTAEEEFSKKKAIEVEAEKDKTIVILSKKVAAKKVHAFRILFDNRWAFKLVGVIVVLFFGAVWLWDIQPFYNKLMLMIPHKAQAHPELVWGVFTCGIALLYGAIKGFLAKGGSPEREKLIYEKTYKKLSKQLSEE